MGIKRVGRLKSIVLIILGIILAILLAVTILLFIWSPGKVEKFVDDKGKVIENSIAEKINVKINGLNQGMFIRGKNKDNPILLFVHGGPIMPEYFLNSKYPTGLEDYFTVCWWEQPGVGLSYNSDISKEDLTVDAIIDDTIEVTNYLRKRFNQDKIYLLGHSWGSFIGIQAVYKNPELYSAYIGVGQITNQSESEKLAYQYMLDKYSEDNNSKMTEKLMKYSITDSDEELLKYFKSSLRDSAMHELGIGTMHNMKSVISGIFMPVMQCREYTLKEKINIWRGKSYVRKNSTLIEDYLFYDIPSSIKELEVPTYFISGAYDYTVNYGLTKEYYDSLNAPQKKFYLIDDAAHSPMFEKPSEFVEIMKNEVLLNK